MYTLIMAANFLIGICIGTCGIAGFLLPIFYTSVLGIAMSDSMAMSFCALTVSGIIGTYSYYKSKEIDLDFAKKIAVGSLIGAIVGVLISRVIPVVFAKRLLYAMVLLSGISLLKNKNQENTNDKLQRIRDDKNKIIIFGFFIGTISSLTGAGGPILSVPILALMGFTVRESVGISLFNSIFICLPAFLGYLGNATMDNIYYVLVLCALTHGLGVVLGAKVSNNINPKILKQGIGIGSALVSVYMILNTF